MIGLDLLGADDAIGWFWFAAPLIAKAIQGRSSGDGGKAALAKAQEERRRAEEAARAARVRTTRNALLALGAGVLVLGVGGVLVFRGRS